MNYKFTTILITMMVLLALFGGPAHSRNDYLNNYGNNCSYGSIDLSISANETDQRYRIPSNSDYDNNRQELRLSFRKNLGIAKKQCDEQNRIITHNMKLMQQLELNKNCPRVNRDTTLQYNSNFKELVAYCKNIIGVKDNKPDDNGSYWDTIKDDYKKENPDVKIMGDKIITNKKKLVIPKYLTDELPIPTN